MNISTSRKIATLGFVISATAWVVSGIILVRKQRREADALQLAASLMDAIDTDREYASMAEMLAANPEVAKLIDLSGMEPLVAQWDQLHREAIEVDERLEAAQNKIFTDRVVIKDVKTTKTTTTAYLDYIGGMPTVRWMGEDFDLIIPEARREDLATALRDRVNALYEVHSQVTPYNAAQGYLADIRGTLWTREGEEVEDSQLISCVRMITQMQEDEHDNVSEMGHRDADDLIALIVSQYHVHVDSLEIPSAEGEGLSDH